MQQPHLSQWKIGSSRYTVHLSQKCFANSVFTQPRPSHPAVGFCCRMHCMHTTSSTGRGSKWLLFSLCHRQQHHVEAFAGQRGHTTAHRRDWDAQVEQQRSPKTASHRAWDEDEEVCIRKSVIVGQCFMIATPPAATRPMNNRSVFTVISKEVRELILFVMTSTMLASLQPGRRRVQSWMARAPLPCHNQAQSSPMARAQQLHSS